MAGLKVNRRRLFGILCRIMFAKVVVSNSVKNEDLTRLFTLG